jgi:tRNA modification GTPase
MALTFDRLTKDTIAAIATAMSESGIGIVRISGPEAVETADRIIVNKKNEHVLKTWKTNSIHYGFVIDGKGEIIDEVMVSLMLAPHSYTTEDTVEINTHGGVYLMHRVLDLVLESGARMAEPGEFTRRAFLNGRIDLSRAEAVMDLISSRNEFSRKVSLAQLKGSLSEKVKELRSSIIYEIAFIESALDDPDSYDLEDYPERLEKICMDLTDQMNGLLMHADEGRILREGIRTVIVGKPNAGKSSLLNYMAGEDLAIVTDVAGTTRDTINESVRMNGVLLNLTDTAGIRDTEDKVERIGIQKTMEAVERADLILFLIDSSSPLSAEDRDIAEMICQEMKEGKKCIVLLNKNDLEAGTDEEAVRDLFIHKETEPLFLSCSLSTGDGLERLSQNISSMFKSGEILQQNEVLLTNMRHKKAVEEARDSIGMVLDSIRMGMTEDFFSMDLMNAYESLGKITGESVEDDLVEEIFSRFCLGK